MRFDWYNATVEEPPLWLRGALEERTGGTFYDGKPRQGYARSAQLVVDGGQVLMELLDGGYNPWPHVVATGANAHEAATVIREVVPNHLVARADVCEDLVAPEWFERAFGVMLDVAKERRVKPMRAGDWDSDKPARTLYLGAPSSAVRVRLYEKGRQLIHEHGDAASAVVPEDWVRLEIQVRPAKRESRLLMARIPPEEWWGCARWAREVSNRLLDVDAPRLAVGTVWKGLQDLERSEYHMLKQYHRVFKRMRDVHGSWEAVGVHIGGLLERGVGVE